jgi:hypothetical protein
MLVRVKSAQGLPQGSFAVSVECSAFKKSLNIGETDMEEDCVWETCFVGPLIDQEKSRTVTMSAAKPEVKFVVKTLDPADNKVKDFAQAVIKPGAAASSSSSASAGGGGITRGQWCTMTELKLQKAGSGALGMLKRAGPGGNLGTISVEAKAMQVNAAGKALLKSNYYVIALRNEAKKPFSFCARTLAVALMGMLTLTSLPFIGDMFNGCFYLSLHGLSASGSLFCMSVPHWCKLFHIPLPKWVKALDMNSLRNSGIALWSIATAGVSMALWWGHGELCTNDFWMLEILLGVDSLLFTAAWWRGEGGGLMGMLMG